MKFMVELYRMQITAGRVFLHEHPKTAKSEAIRKMADKEEVGGSEMHCDHIAKQLGATNIRCTVGWGGGALMRSENGPRPPSSCPARAWPPASGGFR